MHHPQYIISLIKITRQTNKKTQQLNVTIIKRQKVNRSRIRDYPDVAIYWWELQNTIINISNNIEEHWMGKQKVDSKMT